MILVTGGNGQLANCLRDIIPEAKFFSSSELDITNLDDIQFALEQHKPKIVINCGAFTHVDLCEQKQENCFQVNAIGAKNLARASKEHHAAMIQISTDYVFDGTQNTPYQESDLINPQSKYGESKAQAEEFIGKYADKYIIIRTSWLYSEYGKNFVKTIIKHMEEKDELGVVYDQVGSPTYALDLANAIKAICNSKVGFTNQIYHYANEGVASWFDLTKAIQSHYDINCIIKPIESNEYPTPARRPNYSVFNTRKINKDYGIDIPYWRESLELCLKKLS